VRGARALLVENTSLFDIKNCPSAIMSLEAPLCPLPVGTTFFFVVVWFIASAPPFLSISPQIL